MAEPGSQDTAALQEALVHLFDPNVRVPHAPQLVDDLDVFDMPDGLGIQFRGGAFPVVIRGAAAAEAWAYLGNAMDGRTTIADLVANAPSAVGQTSVAKLLSLLHGKGLLQQAAPPANDVPLEQEVFWGRHLGIAGNAASGSELQHRLATARLVLIGNGLLGACLADLLARSGASTIEIVDAGFGSGREATPWTPNAVHTSHPQSLEEVAQLVESAAHGADLVLCAVAGAGIDLPSLINRICCAVGSRLLLALSAESRLDLGPLVQPGESACYECVLLREQSMSSSAMENLLYRAHVDDVNTASGAASEALPVASMYASMVAMEAIRVVTGIAAPTLLDHVTSIEGVRGTMCTNRVPRVPRCPACSRAAVHTTATEFA